MESKVIIPPTLPTFGHSTVYVYPTVSPRVVVVPILTCIFGFPVLVLLIICALRYRARKARTSAKKSHMRRDPSVLELTSGPSILASRCNSEKEPRSSFKKKKTLVRFKPMPEIDLDTVVEEKSEFDAEVSASDLLTTPEEFVIPDDDTPAASFRAYRYMGPVQGAPVPKSPLRKPHGNQHLDNVMEEMDSTKYLSADVDDDDYDDDDDDDDDNDDDERRAEQSEGYDDYDQDQGNYVSPKTEGRVVDGSSGSSDSDTAAACFSLSPKQVTKSPTAVHLALKKLDGVMNRRHSSPVKVNYGGQKAPRSSGKVNYSYTGEDGTLMPEKRKKESSFFDYIDSELMPDISPRSHSVKTPSRKSHSFCSRRRGESFKHKKQLLTRSISHKLSSSQENVKKPDLIEMGECSTPPPPPPRTTLGKSLSVGMATSTPRPVYTHSIAQCEIHVLDENNELSDDGVNKKPNSGANKELRIELDPKAICDDISLTNGSGTECPTGTTDQEDTSYPLASPIHPRSWSCSVTLQSDRNDSDSPSRRAGGGGMGLRPARKAWAENRLGDVTCPTLPLKSPERLIGSIGVDKGRSTTNGGEKHYTNMMNDYSLKYRQDESKYKSQCQSCTITVDSDDERSTLV